MPDITNKETYSLSGIPIFATGTWKGDEYTEDDLDEMVKAFPKVGFRPPIKLGHTDKQKLLQSDGLPAAGWIESIYRKGKKLYADITDIPAKINDLIKKKAYDRVSAEVYWNYDDPKSKRKFPRVLKAVALLGQDIPEVDTLEAISQLYDREGRGFKIAVFADEKEYKQQHSEAWKRCVDKVSAGSPGVDPYAVCTWSLQKTGNLWASKGGNTKSFDLGQEMVIDLEEMMNSGEMGSFGMAWADKLKQKGVKALKMMPDYSIHEIMYAKEEKQMSDNEKKVDDKLAELEKKNQQLSEKLTEYDKKILAADEKNSKLEQRLANSEKKRSDDLISQRVSEYVKAKKITPAQKPLMEAIIKNLPQGELIVCYSKDGTDVEEKKKPDQILEEFVRLQPEFIASKQRTQDGISADDDETAEQERVKAYCKDNKLDYWKHGDYIQALIAVKQGRAA